ncbi:DUF6178 family protein [Geopsychrobacter electrodiphilus]|uniref:DUF6178 family protein n=1 Tax=Geopsychrobacter electrodiphilus TaxID=225196 RepID=UPI00036175E2|nr:DUF6178 family protein [Geopsychrobacter electrodiphilus]
MTKQMVANAFFAPESPRLSAAELNSLSRTERIEVIRNTNGKKKYEMLLNAKDGAQITPKLHPQEIYLTISAIGPEYASELLLMASTEQIITLIDLDCWEGDSLDQKSTLEWLSLLLEAGGDKARETLTEMEPELAALILKQFIKVIAGPEVYDDDDDDRNSHRLEGLYDIDYCNEEAAKVVGGILLAIQQEDEKAWMQLLELVRAELDSVLEEEVFQSRNIRLLDYGFATPAAARRVYARVDPERFKPTSGKQFGLESEGMQSALPLLRLAQPGGLLAEVLVGGITHAVATELCMLANRKMSADLVDLSREESVSASLSQLYAEINLGLEYLARQDVDKASHLFNDCYLQEIFQVGHSLIQKLVDRSKRLLELPVAKLLDGPFKRFIDSLQQNPPQLFCGIRVGDQQRAVEINTLKQLDEINAILKQIEMQQQIASQLMTVDLTQLETFIEGCNIEEATDLTLSDLFLTALANQLLGGDFAPQPLAIPDLVTLHRLVVLDAKLNPQLVAEVRAQLDAQIPGASDFTDYCLEIWHEEFCQLEESDIDPRYLSGLIVRFDT